MTPKTAEAIIKHVKDFNVPAKPSVDEAERVVKTWLRAVGWREDNWGNFLDPQDPNRRYHFKKTQLNTQAKSSGTWSNVSYRRTIDAALSLIVGAAGVVGDQEMVQKYSKGKAKRKEVKEERAKVEEQKREKSTAYEYALKEYARDHRKTVEKMLLGKLDEEGMKAAREEFSPIQERWLEKVKQNDLPEDDSEFASADNPPVVPVLGKAEYVWTETVDGVPYTVKVETTDSKVAEVSIGRAASIGVSALTMRIQRMDPNAVGDAYISGKVVRHASEYQAALFLIMAEDKKKGAGSRILSIWCRMMKGYGIKRWLAEAVGEEGEGFLRALERKGTLKIEGRLGASWIVECTGVPAPSSNPIGFHPTDAEVNAAVASARKAYKAALTKAERALHKATEEAFRRFGETQTDVVKAARDNTLLRAQRAYAEVTEKARAIYRSKLNEIRSGAGQWEDLVPQANPKKQPKETWRINKIGEIGGMPVWTVNGGIIRKDLQRFALGGHHLVYPKTFPDGELFVEESKGSNPPDVVSNAYHERIEYEIMSTKGLDYETAHKASDREEKKIRERFASMKGKLTTKQAMDIANTFFLEFKNKQTRRRGT